MLSNRLGLWKNLGFKTPRSRSPACFLIRPVPSLKRHCPWLGGAFAGFAVNKPGELPSTAAVPGGTEFSGFMDLTQVELPADADYYLCGPLAFMQAIRSSLIGRGVPARDIQYAVFGPDLWMADVQ